MYTFKLSKEQKVAEGTYEIYAIGYTSKDSDSNTLYDFGSFADASSGIFNYQTQTLTSAADPEAEEVFAGSIDRITVDGEGNFALTDNPENNVLTLHRQVAGVIGYYSNIPVLKSGGDPGYFADKEEYNEYVKKLKLRLVSSNANNQIVFAGFNSGFTETGENYKFVVNGSTVNVPSGGTFSDTDTKFNDGTPAFKLYEITLGDWFIGGDTNYDGMLDVNDNRDAAGNVKDYWISPYSDIVGLDFEEGSVFAGKFVIPFVKKQNQNTLELQLVAGSDLQTNEGAPLYAAGDILRTWAINLSSSDAQLKDEKGATVHVSTVDNQGVVAGFGLEEKANSYSLVRNHLYTVGTKGTNDYNPDTDEPQDLSKGQELILKVNDNWELIHKMEVE